MNPFDLGSPADFMIASAVLVLAFIVPVVLVRREQISRRKAARLAGRRA